MRRMSISPSMLCALALGCALPWAAQATDPASGPCGQIVAACTAAGFVKGDAKQGYGLYVDCVDPLMRGARQPAKADKPLPPVPPELIAACKQRHPNFGEAKRAAPAPPKTT